jgi:hypothetical protein
VANLFEVLDKERPRQAAKAIEQQDDLKIILMKVLTQPLSPKYSPIEKLLDWLVNHRDGVTVTAREIYTYGPNCARDYETALHLTGILVEQGWLTPLRTNRRDKLAWEIFRSPARRPNSSYWSGSQTGRTVPTRP